MSQFTTWICLIVGIFVYRLFAGDAIPIKEHAAGIYFSGIALLMHWYATRLRGQWLQWKAGK